jgi:hypothetical protein
MTPSKLTKAQRTALMLANEHGFVEIGKGYGRDTLRHNAIPAATYRALVSAGYLTPHSNGARFAGAALSVLHGKNGYLTEQGRDAAMLFVAALS